MPSATAAQLATFERGKAVFLRRFDRADGLGPGFNVTFCGACHERPTVGGSAGLYRNFVLSGTSTADGAFIAGSFGGVVRAFNYDEDFDAFRPVIPGDENVFAQRNAIPFFGVGLLAELSDEEILSRADPDDADGDGISGRVNRDSGFVGRFGRKAQTVSIEGFIRGPLQNHLGITTDPLSDAQRAMLPVDSSGAGLQGANGGKRRPVLQAAAPEGPTSDDDGVPDPELSGEDLFDLVSFAMLLAAPMPEPPTAQTQRGRDRFDDIGCAACHTPMLNGPRGGIPVYSDLLLHDMGDALADGIVQSLATGSEFRTQPLWGLSAVGPYLHDGRAETVDAAILAHGGEARASREAYAALTTSEQADVVAFMLSLGGRDQFSTGLLPPDAPIPPVGAYGGPRRELTSEEAARFLRGRELFDRDFGHETGVGGPRFNGDSCRACHFEPVLGGAGPRGVNVMRHGTVSADGAFTAPAVGTILHKQTTDLGQPVVPQDGVTVFEHRQTPHTFGLGLIDAIDDATILAGADPDDADGDGISGRASVVADGRVGRFGWKAQVPSIAEFVRDGMAAELGITVEAQPDLTFGAIQDDDDVADPELSAADAEDLVFFIAMLAPPPRQTAAAGGDVALGEVVFEQVGCAKCHIPKLTSTVGPVPLFSDMLLHDILPAGAVGIEDTSAGMTEFRTAPLWGLSQTAPYWHTGEADTIDGAIQLHDGEAAAIRDAYLALDEPSREALLAFLGTL
ncbi:MAG: di-heme oxidoredictase family protein [Phycisphaerae bacterium]